MKFEDLKFEPHPASPLNGIKATVFFQNNYGASIVRFPGSWGYSDGLYEVALIVGKAEDFKIEEDEKGNSYIAGHCTEKDVSNFLECVESLIDKNLEYETMITIKDKPVLMDMCID